MNAAEVIAALDLPLGARVDRRVPKTMLVEYGAPTAADKRVITEGVEQTLWVATLKPETIGVAAYREDDREYLEIAVLCVVLKPHAKASRLVALVHRSVPYPVFLVAETVPTALFLSLAHKRWSQGDSGKAVLDGEPLTVPGPATEDPHGPPFLAALALGHHSRGSLLTLYQGWIDALLALEAARRTGRFEVPVEPDRRAARHKSLRECVLLEAEMVRLRVAASKEKQMSRQVELNLALKRTEASRAAVLARL